MFRISVCVIWSKTLMELIFNPCGEFRSSPEGPVSHIHSHLHDGATLVPKFAVEDLPLGITAALAPEFAVKDLPLFRTV